MLALLTDFVSSRRGKWITVAVWLIAAGSLISQLPMLADANENEQALFLPRDAEATRAYRLAQERFPASGTPVLVVFRQPEGLGPDAYEAAAELAAWLTGPSAPGSVGQVLSPDAAAGQRTGLVSPDGTTMYVFVEVVGEPAEQAFRDTVESIRDRSATFRLPGVEIAAGGPGGLIVDLVGVFAQIDTLLLLVTVLLVMVLLIVIYRSPIMAAIPLLGVGLVFQMAGAIAAWYALRYGIPISGQTTGIMTVVLFGTGTDYVLFVSARFREELTRHADRHEAMKATMRGVGGAVASAGATILVACAALGLATLRSYQALGPVIALSVGLMMLAAVTLIPAVLTIFGRLAFWPWQPRMATRSAPQVDWQRSIYGRVGAVVLRRPGVTLAVTGAALAVLVAGLLPYRENYDQLESLPGNAESVRSFELLRGGFPAGELSPTQLYVSLPPGADAGDPDSLDTFDGLTLALAGHPAVADASGPSRPVGARGPDASLLPPALVQRFVSADGSAGRIDIVLEGEPFSGEALDVVPELRALARMEASELGLPEGSVLIGGDTAEAYDTRRSGGRDSRTVLPLILLAIGVVLALLLRSLIAPLYLMVTIAFTYFATLGLVVVAFVVFAGHAGIGPSVPFFLFVFLNALSVDYNIYLMSRIREEARRIPLRKATHYALARTGPVITSAGLILAGTFSALMTLPLQDLLQLGFGVAIGVLMDTFITRTLIVPSLVSLLARWNWWPSRISAPNPGED
ncbi:MAG: MMPL family transporter [bacterium]|nr:MMPL family transporter [bacterium]MDE0287021.1 MMPL family transporter [bacterium]MDE0437274.1 MMPL family transporter [bacterium]